MTGQDILVGGVDDKCCTNLISQHVSRWFHNYNYIILLNLLSLGIYLKFVSCTQSIHSLVLMLFKLLLILNWNFIVVLNTT